ncbi:hypothetical protein RRG08_045361 [Elysia crispata]|uniref:Uncharacterized protein n=1 Tax=Elysia crispata TaxID=231223 RepID=A0AAE0YAS8_9GAST|nr:hypothetical protein RRG08_045361 [Elysia crispata]
MHYRARSQGLIRPVLDPLGCSLFEIQDITEDGSQAVKAFWLAFFQIPVSPFLFLFHLLQFTSFSHSSFYL